jgi:hypothetical protein
MLTYSIYNLKKQEHTGEYIDVNGYCTLTHSLILSHCSLYSPFPNHDGIHPQTQGAKRGSLQYTTHPCFAERELGRCDCRNCPEWNGTELVRIV